MNGDSPGGPIRWRPRLSVASQAVFSALDSEQARAAFRAESAVEVDGHIEFRFANGERCSARLLERRAPRHWSLQYYGSPVRFREPLNNPAWARRSLCGMHRRGFGERGLVVPNQRDRLS